MQGTIRQIHLRSRNGDTLTSIISSLTPDEDGWNEKIESVVLESKGSTSVDVSNFFARIRLSRLRLLDLSGGIRISPWDRLASRTTLLTTLSLKIHTSPPSPTFTAPQLFSVLTRNPNLQELTLSGVALPDVTDGPASKVPLHDLKTLSLKGEFRHLFELLHRLILPETLDKIELTGMRCTVEDASQTLVPYMRDYFQRDTRFQDVVDVNLSSFPGSISIAVTVEWNGINAPEPDIPYAAFNLYPPAHLPPNVREQLLIDLLEPIPREDVIIFHANVDLKLPEVVFSMMPHIGTFSLESVELYEGFMLPDPDGPFAGERLLPSLDVFILMDVISINGDWSPLTTYLAHQTSGRRRLELLEIVGGTPDMGPEVVKEIKDMVKEFTRDDGSGM